MPRSGWLSGAALGLWATAATVGSAQPVAPEVTKALKWRFIGPQGNRVIAVAGVPGNPYVYYVGAASGGIFKTTDGGTTWAPIFDAQDVSSVGSLAVAPSDPNVVWAGTGESFIRSNISLGNGIYRSTDAGKTWARKGLEKTGRIGRVVIDPRNPDVVLACALGHAYGPQAERGVFRTADGGQTWQRTLFVDENTGCSDLALDPSNPRILYAGMWQLEIRTWGRTSGGAGSGLFQSKDGGVTWNRLAGKGLPVAPLGKVAVAIARSNPSRVYALIETGDGVPWAGWKDHKGQSGQLWRTDDAGETWQVVSHDRQLRGRTHYYTRHAVAPDNENEVYFLTAAYNKTLDGGKTIVDVKDAEAPGGDHHDMWIDPTNGDRQAVAHDGGISLSVNRGRTWSRIQLPVAQMYHVAVDNQIPYFVYGNQQDGPSHRGPSHSRLNPTYGQDPPGVIPRGMWHSVAGGESGWALPDLVDPNVVWATGTGFGSLGGTVERFDLRSRQARRVEVWPDLTIGYPPADLKYRFNWTFPLVISPHDHNVVYVGSQHVHRTTDGGQSWQVISPDLTLNDKTRQQISGGLTPDNIGVEYTGVVFALAESALEKGLLWAGTNDGQVQITRDGGASWTNVTSNLAGLPPWGTVSNIEPSRHAAGTAYLTVDLHQVNNRDPLRLQDDRLWEDLEVRGGGPSAERPELRPLRARGPGPAGNALPGHGERGLRVLERRAQLDAAQLRPAPGPRALAGGAGALQRSRGRDLRPRLLRPRRHHSLAAVESPRWPRPPAHLFAPRPAYRLRPTTEPAMAIGDPSEGKNPPDGAALHYFLKAAPEGDVKIAIEDASGRTIRTLEGTKEAGINRVYWDLRHDKTKEIRLRTSPLFAPEVKLGAEGFRPFPGGGRLAVLAPPGTYTVKLRVAGKEYTERLEVRKDPNAIGTEADVAAQTKVVLEVRDRLNEAADAINQIESIRSQVASLQTLLGEDEAGRALGASAKALEQKLLAIEESLFQMRVTGRGQDVLRYPSRLVEKLVYSVDGLSVADFPPTREQLEVHALLGDQLQGVRARLDEVLKTDVAAFNDLVRQKNLGSVVVRMP